MSFHICLFSYASWPKDNKIVDKQKNNADLNERELLQFQDYVRGEVWEKSVPYGKI